MAYGKRTRIKKNIWDYLLLLYGESGIGKTTLISEVCEKYVGSDGYILLDCGDENGTECLNDIMVEPVKTYKKFLQVSQDIIKNKDTEYPNLRVIVCDTLDELIAITEKYAIDRWNHEHEGEPKFKKARTINAIEGGFDKPYKVVYELIFNIVRQLQNVGVTVWFVAHTKNREVADAATGSSYMSLTSKLSETYFSQFKSKMHFVAIAYKDRTIETLETNKKDIVTKKNKTINKVTKEMRRIRFRDNEANVLDSKSRFANITPEALDFDVDIFVAAIQDAIDEESKSFHKTPASNVPKKEIETIEEDDIINEIEIKEETSIDNEIEENTIEETKITLDDFKVAYKNCTDKVVKATVKKFVTEKAEGKLANLNDEQLVELYGIITA